MKSQSVGYESNNNAKDEETAEASGLIETKQESDNVCNVTVEELSNFVCDIKTIFTTPDTIF